jgi:hypothetical protein
MTPIQTVRSNEIRAARPAVVLQAENFANRDLAPMSDLVPMSCLVAVG